MYQISQWVCMGYLLGLSVCDIRKRNISVWLLFVGFVLAVCSQLIWKETSGRLCLAGALTGGVFLMISKVTGEAIGYGDSILILILGIYMGIWDLLLLLTTAFFLAAVFAVIALGLRHFQKKTVIPFIPFLGVGYFIILLAGGV